MRVSIPAMLLLALIHLPSILFLLIVLVVLATPVLLILLVLALIYRRPLMEWLKKR
jgi:hypothetical protein